jgi:hypothetical protein
MSTSYAWRNQIGVSHYDNDVVPLCRTSYARADNDSLATLSKDVLKY